MIRKLTKLLKCLKTPLGWRGLTRGVAMGTEHLPILRALAPINTVVDIGANRGQFSLAARAVFPGATIFAYEPLPGPAKTFTSVFQDDPKVKLGVLAIGPETKRAVIHISKRDDSSSLLEIGQLQSKTFAGTEEIGTTTIDAGPLNQNLKAPDINGPALLKLDVQGFEKQALEGCEELLFEFSYIYVECSFIELYKGQALAAEVIDYLHAHQFTLIGVHNIFTNPSGVAIQGDFLFAIAD